MGVTFNRNEVIMSAIKESMSRFEAIDKMKQVLESRGDDYGTPRHNHGIASDLINAYLKHHPNRNDLQPEDTMIMMVLIKVARLVSTPQHIDSIMDIAGYAFCAIDAINEIKTKGE